MPISASKSTDQGNGREMYSIYLEFNESVLVSQSCLTICDLMDCSSLGPSVHGILQARILEWVAMLSSRWSSRPRDWTRVSCFAGGFFTIRATDMFLNILLLTLTVTLFGDGVFADIIKLWWGRIGIGDPNPMIGVLVKRESLDRDINTERGRRCEKRSGV